MPGDARSLGLPHDLMALHLGFGYSNRRVFGRILFLGTP